MPPVPVEVPQVPKPAFGSPVVVPVSLVPHVTVVAAAHCPYRLDGRTVVVKKKVQIIIEVQKYFIIALCLCLTTLMIRAMSKKIARGT